MKEEPIFEESYWANRLHRCGGEIHRAVFNGSVDQFSGIQAEHRRTLHREIKPNDSILDCGCGYGRLLDQLPNHWRLSRYARYVGVDLSPDFIKIAQLLHPARTFYCLDLRNMGGQFQDKQFDVAVVCAVKAMVVRNAGEAEWAIMEREIDRVSKRILYLTFGEWD